MAKKLVCAMNTFTTVARVRYSFVCVRDRAACLRDLSIIAFCLYVRFIWAA